MASIKDLKKRIGTVKNTQQTTRAMKMVSAAKLRRAQEAILNQRPYARHVLGALKEVWLAAPDRGGHPLITGKTFSEGQERPKQTLVLVVTSDRGLCGGFNGAVIKTAQKWLAAHPDPSCVQFALIGRKGNDFFKTRKVNIRHFFAEYSGKVTFPQAKQLAETLIDDYLMQRIDEVKIIYNEFKNAVTQRPVIEDFLPLQSIGQESVDHKTFLLLRPSRAEVLDELLQKNFAVQLFRILLESQAGEHGARMSAMENATKNAGEMIKKLALQYNKQRQAGITKELLEIISGSESQKSDL